MKRTLLLVIVLLIFVIILISMRNATTKPLQSSNIKPGDYTNTISIDNIKRTYIVHIPSGYSAKQSHPLLFLLHGAGGNAQALMNQLSPYLNNYTDPHGIIIAYPNGTNIDGNSSSLMANAWNAGGCCGYPQVHNTNDVKFLEQVFASLQKMINIDTGKIAIGGLSNGGIMAYRMACESTMNTKAILVVSGSMNIGNCDPSHTSSIFIIHGTDDPIIPYNGGTINIPQILGIVNNPDIVTIPSTKEVVNFWVQNNDCHSSSKNTKGDVTIQTYGSCKDNSKVVFATANNQGHTPINDINLLPVLNAFIQELQ